MDKSIHPIAIQGIEGSFHEWAASQYYNIEKPGIIPCSTFRLLAQKIEKGEAMSGLMAIENTLAGSILPNYALLEEYKLWVSGEIYLPIHQCLLAVGHQDLESISEVRSHPMALLQCAEYLDNHPWMKPVEHHDTAESAKEISDQQLHRVASIASERAAKLFGLQVLVKNIETNPKNFTRFLVVEKQPGQEQFIGNKAMISMQLADKPGMLWAALDLLKQREINMTKIQSLPVVGKPYTYSFHADLEWNSDVEILELLSNLKHVTEKLTLLGIYKRGTRET